MEANPSNGIVTLPSRHSVDDTVANIQQILAAKNIQLFAVVDHSGEAAKVGLDLPPTKLLIFGNAKAGTPLMLASPTTALDLPLKLLVAQNGAGEVLVSYNSPSYLQERHGFPLDLLPNIAALAAIAAQAAA